MMLEGKYMRTTLDLEPGLLSQLKEQADGFDPSNRSYFDDLDEP